LSHPLYVMGPTNLERIQILISYTDDSDIFWEFCKSDFYIY
jgi:hypothetical protein